MGQIAWQYLKARPTPGPEAAVAIKSDGRMRQLDTPYPVRATAICSLLISEENAGSTQGSSPVSPFRFMPRS